MASELDCNFSGDAIETVVQTLVDRVILISMLHGFISPSISGCVSTRSRRGHELLADISRIYSVCELHRESTVNTVSNRICSVDTQAGDDVAAVYIRRDN